jgi:hypothetical protein
VLNAILQIGQINDSILPSFGIFHPTFAFKILVLIFDKRRLMGQILLVFLFAVFWTLSLTYLVQ